MPYASLTLMPPPPPTPPFVVAVVNTAVTPVAAAVVVFAEAPLDLLLPTNPAVAVAA